MESRRRNQWQEERGVHMFTLTWGRLAGSLSYSTHYVEALSLDALYFCIWCGDIAAVKYVICLSPAFSDKDQEEHKQAPNILYAGVWQYYFIWLEISEWKL